MVYQKTEAAAPTAAPTKTINSKTCYNKVFEKSKELTEIGIFLLGLVGGNFNQTQIKAGWIEFENRLSAFCETKANGG